MPATPSAPRASGLRDDAEPEPAGDRPPGRSRAAARAFRLLTRGIRGALPRGTRGGLPRGPRDAASQERPGGGRRRPWVVAVAVVVALTVLAAGANLLLAHTARRRIAHAAMCSLRPTGPVEASLSGSLAGLRLLTGQVGSVHIEAQDVRRDGLELSVAADLHRVSTKGTTSGGTATATISYRELGKRLGSGVAGLRPGADGHGGLLLTGTLAGIPLPVTVHTKITTGTDRLTVAPTDVTVLGRVIPMSELTGSQGNPALAAKLAPRTVKAPRLPTGVTLTGARAGDDGLGLTLALPRSISSGTKRSCGA